MNNYQYRIGKNEAINRWMLTDVSRSPFQSPNRAFEADINLGEGYVQIVYPVREAFLKKNMIDQVTFDKPDYENMYFPFENNRVEFTTFIHTPHYLSFRGETYIHVEEDQEVQFELYTCGGVKLWVNEEEVLTFKPYTRNIGSKQSLCLSFKKGINKINVYADELAERDVFFYFELRNVSGEVLDGIIPVKEDVQELYRLEDLMKSLYVGQDAYNDGVIQLHYDKHLLKEDITLSTNLPMVDNKSKDNFHPVKLLKNSNYVPIAHVNKVKQGTFNFLIRTRLGSFIIDRNLVVANYRNQIEDIHGEKSSIQQRKQMALEHITQNGDNILMRAMAIIKTEGKLTEEAKACLMATVNKIRRKEDCADFYLGSVIMFLRQYREYIDQPLYEDIKKVILDFRYWIDEPGNDVMWFFSENHALLFHIGQYLAGDLFPDETFTASNRLGSEQKSIGKARLVEWFDLFNQYGFAEWNSVTYIPVDLIGFFNLYDLAPDEEIKSLAKKALDFTFKIMALHNFKGILSSSYGRVYEGTLKGRELSAPSFIEWITAGKGFINNNTSSTTLYALSDYEPENYYSDIQLEDDEAMIVSMVQGINENHLTTYATNDYMMSSIEGFNPYVHGHQQHLMNIALGETSTQFHINHPGERVPSGGGRPSYWAGNGTNPLIRQYKNAQLVIFNIEEYELVHYIHGYIMKERYDHIFIKGNDLYLKCGNAYLAIKFSQPIKMTDSGANTGKEVIAKGLNHGIYVRCGSKYENGSFEAFIKAVESSHFQYDGMRKLEVHDYQHGELCLDADNQFSVKGVIREIDQTSQLDYYKEKRMKSIG